MARNPEASPSYNRAVVIGFGSLAVMGGLTLSGEYTARTVVAHDLCPPMELPPGEEYDDDCHLYPTPVVPTKTPEPPTQVASTPTPSNPGGSSETPSSPPAPRSEPPGIDRGPEATPTPTGTATPEPTPQNLYYSCDGRSFTLQGLRDTVANIHATGYDRNNPSTMLDVINRTTVSALCATPTPTLAPTRQPIVILSPTGTPTRIVVSPTPTLTPTAIPEMVVPTPDGAPYQLPANSQLLPQE